MRKILLLCLLSVAFLGCGRKTIIGVSLSSRKRKGGMGLYLGIGLGLSFTYILLQTISATFAINADTPPVLAAWMPNILYLFIAYYCYRQAPN